jgi:cation diffusion facilitator family transporter
MSTAQERARWAQAAGWASVSAALLILGLKGVAWWQTQSASVLAALVDSAMDLISSAINLLALRFAARPADDNHRYGHGKAEALAAFVQSVLLIGSAVAILLHAAKRLHSGASMLTEQRLDGVWLMLAVLLVTALLVLFQREVIRRTGSALVAADSLHYRSDFLINGSVLVAMLLAGAAAWLDAAAALLIAVYLTVAAGRILKTSVNELLDRELPASVDERLLALVRRHPEVRGVHGLRTRRVGSRFFVQMDLEFPGAMPLRRVHDVSAALLLEMQQLYPDVDVQFHFDPAGDEPMKRSEVLP